jgi:raffinose/stachyose/melibiose transport system substrate-binding protein
VRRGEIRVTLTLTSITDANVGWQAMIAAYKKADPNVTIKATYAPTDQLQTALRAQLGAGNAPDLFVDWPGNGSAMAVQQLAPTSLVADLSGQQWIKAVPNGLKPLLGDKGKTYMWSPGVTPIGVIYNKQVLKQAGISSLPTTWNELLADARKIKAAGRPPLGCSDTITSPSIPQSLSVLWLAVGARARGCRPARAARRR